MRQTTSVATAGATTGATTTPQPPSLRDLARDTLVRQQRDKAVAGVPALTLVVSINRACDSRGDDDSNRTALIEECTALPAHFHADALAHFETEAERFERANRCEA
ncbi:MAG: hypothetical protein ABIP94_20200 [Planctomycetota bacterium]